MYITPAGIYICMKQFLGTILDRKIGQVELKLAMIVPFTLQGYQTKHIFPTVPLVQVQ